MAAHRKCVQRTLILKARLPQTPIMGDREEKSSFEICPWNIHRYSAGGCQHIHRGLTFFSLAWILHHQHCRYTVEDKKQKHKLQSCRSKHYVRSRLLSISAGQWSCQLGHDLLQQEEKFSLRVLGNSAATMEARGQRAACLMDAERAGWVSVLRVTAKSSGSGQWTQSVLRGFQTAPIIHVTVRLWARRVTITVKSWRPEELTRQFQLGIPYIYCFSWCCYCQK